MRADGAAAGRDRAMLRRARDTFFRVIPPGPGSTKIEAMVASEDARRSRRFWLLVADHVGRAAGPACAFMVAGQGACGDGTRH